MAYKPRSDRPLFVVANLLAIFGLLMVYSASSVASAKLHNGMSGYFFLPQLVFAAMGYIMMVLLMNVDYHVWQRKRVLRALLLASAAGLVLVFVMPEVNGAHRWIRYGRASFQPSEIAKLVLLIYVADYLHRHEAEINQFKTTLLPCTAVLLSFAALIAKEPDLGQAFCIILIAAVLLFIAGLSWKYVGAAFAIGVPAMVIAVLIEPYRFERVATFITSQQDLLGSEWQSSQSLTAVGSGGLLGLGLGAGRQKLFFVPEASSDFIFAIIGEELGLIGGLLVCVAFLFFFYRGIRIALKAPDLFGFYLALGITLMVVVQAFINISMVLAMMPTKGIALPFISQGGSCLLVNMLATGVLLNISNYVEKSDG